VATAIETISPKSRSGTKLLKDLESRGIRNPKGKSSSRLPTKKAVIVVSSSKKEGCRFVEAPNNCFVAIMGLRLIICGLKESNEFTTYSTGKKQSAAANKI
jgi:hypothetical protein